MPWCCSQFLLTILLTICVGGCDRKTNPGNSSTPQAKTLQSSNDLADQFLRLMNEGKNFLDQGNSSNAITVYRKAEAILPNDLDLRLSMANAYLAAGLADQALREADGALRLEPNSAAAYFIRGSALLREAQYEEAVKSFENARKIEPGVVATLFQLGLARTGLKQWKEAITAFQEGIALDPNHLHASAHYLLGQALLRDGRTADGERELSEHQSSADAGGTEQGRSSFERCKYTQARVPFRLDQPESVGIPVHYSDATSEVFGKRPEDYSGPVGIIPASGKGAANLLVIEKSQRFRFLWNTNNSFQASELSFPLRPGATYSKVLVGDLQNDRFNDIIVLGNQGSHLFADSTNGSIADLSATSPLNALRAKDGLLMDIDFTGKLDLVVVEEGERLKVYRQFGPLQFRDISATSGIPESLIAVGSVVMEDWNRDDQMDLIVGRNNAKPLLLEKERGGRVVPREIPAWNSGSGFCMADFDNDLRPDFAMISDERLSISFNNGSHQEFAVDGAEISQLIAIDFDNDGWLDLWAAGTKLRAWRNRGAAGFLNQTSQLGLEKFQTGSIRRIYFADFDKDCDPDVILELAGGGLRYLRNDGGNANRQVKVLLQGNRSNASGLGCKVEITAEGLRLLRTVQTLPIEVGVGKHQILDSFLVHWFNWPQGSVEVPVACDEPVLSLEQTIQEGSCPYAYAWDGEQFRFVTDILGAAPLGLPVAEGHYIEPNPQEIVWIGNEQTFRPREGAYEVRITEELREALYLDDVKLLVVDRQEGREVHSTSKLLPGPPFAAEKLVTLKHEQPLLRAETLDGKDVTQTLQLVDGKRVSPSRLLGPQLRGLAEPHGVILDFGAVDVTQPIVLVLNGWLRFGGGMANIAASHDPSLPFPFPRLEAELSNGEWERVDVVVGAPAGKTKTILVDLEGKLKAGTRRLRLTQAFEIYWDRIALLQKDLKPETRVVKVRAVQATLRFHGFSKIQDLPPDWPLTPAYSTAEINSCWTIIPGGWCTRYGDVSEMISSRDEALAVVNSGDELALRFDSHLLASKSPGITREFFLYVDGWDKDSDFHVARGAAVEPLPFHGMDAQQYGRETRPSFPSDEVNRRFNTRWVESRALKTHFDARR